MQIHRQLDNLPEFKNAVLTIGSFDGVHIGHQKLISRIRQLAIEISGESVIITFHPHPRQVIFPNDKSLNLLTSLEEKLILFKKYGVDHVIVVPFSVEFSQQNPREYIEKFLINLFKPSFIVIGYDHRFGLNRQGDIRLLKTYEASHNFEIIEIEKQELYDITISSTKIRESILNNEMIKAMNLLNHPYMLSGKVIHGQKLGSKIGFKTANLQIDNTGKLIPSNGIYAAQAVIEKELYDGMLYIGTKPTITDSQNRTIELNIFDFDQNIYGQQIQINIIAYLRDDQKFDSIEEMVDQLKRDEKHTRLVLAKNELKLESKANTAIAVLNYNGEEILESYLPSTLISSSKNIDYILIDNHSTDKSLDFLKEWHPEYQLIELTKNYGYAGGYNKGLEQIEHKYIALINSDIQCTEHWLDPIIERMEEDPSIAAISPKILSIEEPEKFEYAGAAGGFIDNLGYPFCRGRIFNHIETDQNQYDEEKEIFWASGAAMVIRKSVFDKFGGFDSSFFAHQEEIDLCWRMKNAGYKVLVLPNSKVYHLGGGTLAYESPRKTYLNFRNNLISLIKNENSSWFLKFVLRLFLDGLAAIQMVFQGNSKNAYSVLRAHWYIFPRFWKIINMRKETKRIVEQNKIGPPRVTGKYRRSIVLDFFLLKKKNFSELKIK